MRNIDERLTKETIMQVKHLGIMRAAKELGVDYYSLRKYAAKYQITFDFISPNRVDISDDNLKRANEIGLTALSNEIGISTKTIMGKMKQRGIKFVNPRFVSISEEDLRRVSHLTLNRAAKKLGFDFATVGKNARLHNISFATKVEPELINFEQLTSVSHLSYSDAAKILNVSAQTVGIYSKKLGVIFNRLVTSPERSIMQILDELSIEYIINDRSVIGPLELDFFLPEHNVAIEVNGVYWHSLKYKDKNYHQKKYLLCKEKNIRLMQFTDLDILYRLEIVKSMIRHKVKKSQKLHARKCKIQLDMPKLQINTFLQESHLQGKSLFSNSIALTCENNIVAVLTYGKSRFKKDDSIEILRFAVGLGYSISGAFSKLMKVLLSITSKDIITYHCNSLGINSVYTKVGFVLDHRTTPNYIWVGQKGLTYTRYQSMKHRLPKILKEKFDKDLTEVHNMNSAGFFQFFDAGNTKYIFKR